MKDWLRLIKRLGACEEALEWGENYATIEEAWQSCERGVWMLWLLGKLSGAPETDSRKKLVLTACQCARLALPHVEKGETKPLKAIETAEAWAMGEGGITLQDVRNTAAYAAYAVYAVYAADAADARSKVLKQCADIVREYYPEPPSLSKGG